MLLKQLIVLCYLLTPRPSGILRDKKIDFKEFSFGVNILQIHEKNHETFLIVIH